MWAPAPTIQHKKTGGNTPPVGYENSIVKKQQGIPGDDVAAILELQAVFFQHRNYVDAVALNAGVHPVRETAGFAV